MKDPKKYFIDTNVFLRALVKEDERSFEESVRLLDLVRNGEIVAYTSCLVMAEVSWVLGKFYDFSKEQIAFSLKTIVALKNLKIDDRSDAGAAVSLYEKNNVKFVDALIASLAIVRKKNLTILSYDKDFAKLPVKWLRPKEVLKK